MNLKPFNLEAALRGEKVVTRDGREVTEIFHSKTVDDDEISVIAVLNGNYKVYLPTGAFWKSEESHNDLFMAPTEKTYYINLSKSKDLGLYMTFGKLYNSLEEAKETAISNDHWDFVKTISFTIEE